MNASKTLHSPTWTEVRRLAIAVPIALMTACSASQPDTASPNDEAVRTPVVQDDSAANLAVVQRFVRDIKNRKNREAADEILHPQFQHHFPIPGLPPGLEGFAQVSKLLGAAFTDVAVTPQFFLADGDKVVERSHVTALHSGDFLGVPATNKTVRWTETHIYRIEEGRIIEHWPELDFLGVMGQINPPPGS